MGIGNHCNIRGVSTKWCLAYIKSLRPPSSLHYNQKLRTIRNYTVLKKSQGNWSLFGAPLTPLLSRRPKAVLPFACRSYATESVTLDYFIAKQEEQLSLG